MTLSRAVLAAGILWFGLMTGFFYAYSATVSPGLAAAAPIVALEAMQSINASVRNMVFAIGFWGALLVALGLLAVMVLRRGPGWAWVSAAALIYLAGAVAVTLFGSVPLNQALALVDPASAEAPRAILDYLRDWTALNHIRTAASAAALLICALVAVRTEA